MKTVREKLDIIKKKLVLLCSQPHKIYLIVGLIGALGFAVITPPFQGPDEPEHYIRVQYIAHGHIIPVNPKSTGASLPKSIGETLRLTFYDDEIRGFSAKKYDFNRTKQAVKRSLNPSERYQPPMVSYNFLTYLPAVPGVFLANVFNLSPVISLYVARILLALASVVIVYFAIKLLPGKKYLFTFVALLPMMLFQQSMVGTDGVSYALLLLFLAYTLRLYVQSTDIQRNQWIKLAMLCGAIVWSKPLLYLFLPLIIILVKKKHFWRWSIAATIISVLLLGANIVMANNAGEYEYRSDSLPQNIQSDKQLQNLKEHPKRGPRVLWNSYMTSFGDDESRGVIGTFGAADTLYPLWMGYIYIFVLGMTATVSLGKDKSKFTIPNSWRWLAVGLAAVHFVAVNVAIYLTYTPYNFDIIYGVQGRYFLPTLIIIFMAIFLGRGAELKQQDKKTIITISSLIILSLVIMALLITFQRYFMYTP